MKQEYRHMMEQAALSTEKKEEILAMFENQTTGTRRMPKAAKLVLAAALAAGCVLSIAAGLPAQVYNFVSGGVMTVLPGTNQAFWDFRGENASPITVKDGRVWLEADGQKLDITGKTDENTPYILERTDPATGNKGWLVVGGSAEDLGWAELVQLGEACSISGENFATPGSIDLDSLQDITNEDGTFTFDERAYVGEIMESTVNRPWLDKALEQLGLDWD